MAHGNTLINCQFYEKMELLKSNLVLLLPFLLSSLYTNVMNIITLHLSLQNAMVIIYRLL
jgi:hypothetical protein